MFPTNLGAAANSVRDRVGAAIQQAAMRTDVDFGYLLNQAKIESGLDPNARARTSSATGLFQFIEQTWLGTVKKHGAAHGLGWAADSIACDGGRYRIADPAARQAILDLRNDPEAASAMAAEFASDNGAFLEARLGRRPEAVDLYLAHFLGPAGAAEFLQAHDASPDAAAADLLPKAARANRRVFFDGSGAPRSFAEIRERFAAKIGGEVPPARPGRALDDRGLGENEFMPLQLASRDLGAGAAAAPRVLPSPQYARLAYLMLAELGA